MGRLSRNRHVSVRDEICSGSIRRRPSAIVLRCPPPSLCRHWPQMEKPFSRRPPGYRRILSGFPARLLSSNVAYGPTGVEFKPAFAAGGLVFLVLFLVSAICSFEAKMLHSCACRQLLVFLSVLRCRVPMGDSAIPGDETAPGEAAVKSDGCDHLATPTRASRRQPAFTLNSSCARGRASHARIPSLLFPFALPLLAPLLPFQVCARCGHARRSARRRRSRFRRCARSVRRGRWR